MEDVANSGEVRTREELLKEVGKLVGNSILNKWL